MKKGIILAGGDGTRLGPITTSVSKQLLPVYDKPLIYYPLTTLIDANVNEILIITKKNNLTQFFDLLGDGSQFGIKIKYEIQNRPNGIAEAFIIGEKFIKKDNVILILGDNIFSGIDFSFANKISNIKNFGSIIFSYFVDDPERYGVIKYNNNAIIKIKEKPIKFISSNAITGLYFFDNNVVKFAKKLKPSKRNELEIIDIINKYLKISKLKHVPMKTGAAWLDAGNPKSLLQASQWVQTIQDRQKYLIGSPELSALKKKLITKKQYINLIKNYKDSNYKSELLNFVV